MQRREIAFSLSTAAFPALPRRVSHCTPSQLDDAVKIAIHIESPTATHMQKTLSLNPDSENCRAIPRGRGGAGMAEG
jgi:hypothetical protein